MNDFNFDYGIHFLRFYKEKLFILEVIQQQKNVNLYY
jgi:hypothetical protein